MKEMWRKFWVWFHQFDDVASCPYCEREVFIRHKPVRPVVKHAEPICPKWSREEA